jgi:hypothetical protein
MVALSSLRVQASHKNIYVDYYSFSNKDIKVQ